MASTKIFTLFAGVNGAGKSTLFSVDTAADLGVRLNTDEIVKERGWDWRDASAQLRAGRELLRRQIAKIADAMGLRYVSQMVDDKGRAVLGGVCLPNENSNTPTTPTGTTKTP